MFFNPFRRQEIPVPDLTPHQFQRSVAERSQSALNPSEWRVRSPGRKKYLKPGREPVVLCPDLHIAERRQGGKAIVLDAKDFKHTPLNRNEVDTTDEYRKRTRASHAVLAVSPDTKVPQSVHDHVVRIGRMTILPVDNKFEDRLVALAKKVRRTG